MMSISMSVPASAKSGRKNGDWLGTTLCLSPFFPAAQPFPDAHIHAGRFSGIANTAIEFASLPGEFATVGKLSWRRNGTEQQKLRPKKN
jgi:hypothetical protein